MSDQASKAATETSELSVEDILASIRKIIADDDITELTSLDDDNDSHIDETLEDHIFDNNDLPETRINSAANMNSADKAEALVVKPFEENNLADILSPVDSDPVNANETKPEKAAAQKPIEPQHAANKTIFDFDIEIPEPDPDPEPEPELGPDLDLKAPAKIAPVPNKDVNLPRGSDDVTIDMSDDISGANIANGQADGISGPDQSQTDKETIHQNITDQAITAFSDHAAIDHELMQLMDMTLNLDIDDAVMDMPQITTEFADHDGVVPAEEPVDASVELSNLDKAANLPNSDSLNLDLTPTVHKGDTINTPSPTDSDLQSTSKTYVKSLDAPKAELVSDIAPKAEPVQSTEHTKPAPNFVDVNADPKADNTNDEAPSDQTQRDNEDELKLVKSLMADLTDDVDDQDQYSVSSVIELPAAINDGDNAAKDDTAKDDTAKDNTIKDNTELKPLDDELCDINIDNNSDDEDSFVMNALLDDLLPDNGPEIAPAPANTALDTLQTRNLQPVVESSIVDLPVPESINDAKSARVQLEAMPPQPEINEIKAQSVSFEQDASQNLRSQELHNSYIHDELIATQPAAPNPSSNMESDAAAGAFNSVSNLSPKVPSLSDIASAAYADAEANEALGHHQDDNAANMSANLQNQAFDDGNDSDDNDSGGNVDLELRQSGSDDIDRLLARLLDDEANSAEEDNLSAENMAQTLDIDESMVVNTMETVNNLHNSQLPVTNQATNRNESLNIAVTLEETPDMANAASRNTDMIMDNSTEAVTSNVFAQLNQVVEEKAIVAERGDRVGDLVMEALRPMLKSWLDENLQDIVERAVTKEVKRISSGK